MKYLRTETRMLNLEHVTNFRLARNATLNTLDQPTYDLIASFPGLAFSAEEQQSINDTALVSEDLTLIEANVLLEKIVTFAGASVMTVDTEIERTRKANASATAAQGGGQA